MSLSRTSIRQHNAKIDKLFSTAILTLSQKTNKDMISKIMNEHNAVDKSKYISIHNKYYYNIIIILANIIINCITNKILTIDKTTKNYTYFCRTHPNGLKVYLYKYLYTDKHKYYNELKNFSYDDFTPLDI